MRQISANLNDRFDYRITLYRHDLTPDVLDPVTQLQLDLTDYHKSMSPVINSFGERKDCIKPGKVNIVIPLDLVDEQDKGNIFYRYTDCLEDFGLEISAGIGSQVKIFDGSLVDLKKKEEEKTYKAVLSFVGWGKTLDDTKTEDLKDPNTAEYYKNIYLLDILNLLLDSGGMQEGDQHLTAPVIEFAEKSWDFYKAFKKADDGVSLYDAGDKVTAYCYDTLRSRNYVGIDNKVYYFDSATRDFRKLLTVNPTLEEEDTITHLEYDAVADYLRGEIRNKTYSPKTHRGNARARFDFDLTTNLVMTDAVEMQPIYDNGIYIFSKNINQQNVDPDTGTKIHLRFQSVGWALAPGQKENGFFFQAPLLVSDTINVLGGMVKGQNFLDFGNIANQSLFNIGDRLGVCAVAVIAGVATITNLSDCGFLTGLDSADPSGAGNTISIPLKYTYGGITNYAIFKFPEEKYTYNFFVNEPSHIWIEYATNTVHGKVAVEIFLRHKQIGYGNTLGEQKVGELEEGERLFLAPGFYCARASVEEGGHSDPIAGYEDWHTNYVVRPFWVCIDKRQAKQAPDLTNNIYCWNNYQGLSERPDPALTMFEHWQFMPHGAHIIPAYDKPEFAWYDLDNLDNYLRIGNAEKAYHTIGKGYYTKVDNYVYFCVNELELNEDWGSIIFKNKAKILRFDFATGRLDATVWEDDDYEWYFSAPPYHKNSVLHLSMKRIYPRWVPKDHRIFGIKLPATTDGFPDMYEASDKRLALVTIGDDQTDEYSRGDIIRLNPKHSELDPDGDFLGEKQYTLTDIREWKYTDRPFECEDVGTQTTPVTDMLIVGAGTKWRWDEIRQWIIELVEEYSYEYWEEHALDWEITVDWVEELEAYYAGNEFKTKYQAQLTTECACKYIWKQEGWEEGGCAWRAFDLGTDTMSTLFTGYGDVAEIPEGKELEDKDWGEEQSIGELPGMPAFLYYFGVIFLGAVLKNPNVVTSSVKVYMGGQEFTVEEVDKIPTLPPEPGKCFLINRQGMQYNGAYLLFDDRYNLREIRIEYQYRDNDLYFDKFCEDDDGNVCCVEQGSGKWYVYDGSDVTLNSMVKLNETGIDFVDPQGSTIYAILNPSNLLAKFSVAGTGYLEEANFRGAGVFSAVASLAFCYDCIFYITPTRQAYFKSDIKLPAYRSFHTFNQTEHCKIVESDMSISENFTGVKLKYRNGEVSVGDVKRLKEISISLIFSKPMAVWLINKLNDYFQHARKYNITVALDLAAEPGDDCRLESQDVFHSGTVRQVAYNLPEEMMQLEVIGN